MGLPGDKGSRGDMGPKGSQVSDAYKKYFSSTFHDLLTISIFL